MCSEDKKRKWRGPFTRLWFLMERAGGNGGIGCTKGREAQLRVAAAGRLIRGFIL